MAYAALSILLESLELFSSPNRCFVLVRSEKLQSLTENLVFFQDFLENSTEKSYDKEMMESVEGKIREVVCKAQDVIEEFVCTIPCPSQDLLIDIFDEKCTIHHILQQMLQEIDSVKAEAFKLGETISMEDTNTMVINDLAIKDGNSTNEDYTLVNFDEGTRIILDRLLSFSSVLEIASITLVETETEWGHRLTYLACKVLDHPLAVSYFKIRVWVSVRRESSLQFFVIYHIEGGKTSIETHCGVEDMVKYLSKTLKSHRYLAVVRNYAPSFQDFLQIQSWFPEDHNGSRVIFANRLKGITTTGVISHSSVDPLARSEPFSLQLREHFPVQNFIQAWGYLREKLFEADESCPHELIPIGMQIAKICQGARRVLDDAARLLSGTSMTNYHWGKVAKSIGHVLQVFFPEKMLYIYDRMPQLSEEVDSPRISEEKEEENAVVGLEDDLIKVKHQLTGQSHHLEIITVVGMGGIGKTTMAKAVFDDPLIQYHFYVRAWMKVSQVYQLRDLLLRVLHNIGHLDDEIHRMNAEQLREKLYRKLKGRRFLIVIDDLWSTQAWDYMRGCFPDDNNGSRILLTTRVKNLAVHVCSKDSLHEMRLLNKELSWELLHYQISRKKTCPDELIKIGKKIAEKCQGLPLSIILIAGVLSNMSETRHCWENVAESLNSILTSDPEKCLEILALSYNYLPQHLKACFLYLCAFPEDCEIDCRILNRLWVAEGFVRAESGRNLEEMAEEYLEDLTNRGLVLVVKRNSFGKIRTCQLHDLLRDLSLREAQKENFMEVITRNIQVHSEDNIVQRRLSFHSGSCGDFQPDPSIQLTRSFLCFVVGFDTIPDAGFVLSKFHFQLLRVLDVNFLRFDYFPDLILNLIHLRFLALTAACEIPSSISKLLNLQTLIVHGPWLCWRLGKTPTLPGEIWKMSQLRHLNLTAAVVLAGPVWDEDDASSSLFLKNLQTLNTIRPTSCTEQLFLHLPNLKKLGICQIREDMEPRSGTSDFLNNLIHLHQLETLKCSFYVQNRKAKHFLTWHVFPQRLKKLTLSGGYFPWTDMERLGKLPNLEVLKLKNYAFQGPTWEADEGGFQSLRVLVIDNTDLMHWNAYRCSFPRLESLVLRFCESLKEIPFDIANYVQLIELHNCSASVEGCASEVKEEHRKEGYDGLVVRIIK